MHLILWLFFFAGCQGLNCTQWSVSPLFRVVKLVWVIFSRDTGRKVCLDDGRWRNVFLKKPSHHWFFNRKKRNTTLLISRNGILSPLFVASYLKVVGSASCWYWCFVEMSTWEEEATTKRQGQHLAGECLHEPGGVISALCDMTNYICTI